MAIFSHVFDQILSALNRHDADEVIQHLTEEAVYENMPDALPYDRRGAHAFFASLFAGFPDLRFVLSNRFQCGSWIIAETLMLGMHRGRFRDLEPTGRPLKLPVLFLMEFRGPRVAIWRTYFDAATLLYQLGIIGEGWRKVRQSG